MGEGLSIFKKYCCCCCEEDAEGNNININLDFGCSTKCCVQGDAVDGKIEDEGYEEEKAEDEINTDCIVK